jgi:hypothetical protein
VSRPEKRDAMRTVKHVLSFPQQLCYAVICDQTVSYRIRAVSRESMSIETASISAETIPTKQHQSLADRHHARTFMELLDTAIANVSLPHIAGGLATSHDESTWVLTSDLVANAIGLPLSAWLSRVFGRKNYSMTCVALFSMSSLMCGLGPILGLLISFRILQGLGGGGLAPVEQAILVDKFPPGQVPCRLRPLQHGHCDRTGNRASAGRMDYRQSLLAMGVLPPLIEPPGRPRASRDTIETPMNERNRKEAAAPAHLVKTWRGCADDALCHRTTVPLWNDHGCAVDGITFHRNQSFIGLIERKRGNFGLKIKLRGNA